MALLKYSSLFFRTKEYMGVFHGQDMGCPGVRGIGSKEKGWAAGNQKLRGAVGGQLEKT